MLFPPAMVEIYGREWPQGLPVDRIETVGDGGLLLVATEDLADPEARAVAVESLRDPLGDRR